jgi:hypothetical protein
MQATRAGVEMVMGHWDARLLQEAPYKYFLRRIYILMIGNLSISNPWKSSLGPKSNPNPSSWLLNSSSLRLCVSSKGSLSETPLFPVRFLLAHVRMWSYLDLPIRVVAVTNIWRQCRHRSTVLFPVSRSSMLRMAVFNLSSVPASSIRVGHCGLTGTTL